MLELAGIQSGYGSSQVLFGVSLHLQAGQVLTLLGRNGMGKTTTLRTLMGTLPLREGDIRWKGQSIAALPVDARARLGLAIVPEGRQCFPNLTVEEHLTAFARPGPDGRRDWTLEALYKLFPRLRERRNNMGNQLSGGEQQMLAIARALSVNPAVLILDEATEGLAPLIREEIWACLAQLRSVGQTTIVVDKYVERLLGLADRHVILERGQVVWEGDSAALDADRGLWSRYLGV